MAFTNYGGDANKDAAPVNKRTGIYPNSDMKTDRKWDSASPPTKRLLSVRLSLEQKLSIKYLH